MFYTKILLIIALLPALNSVYERASSKENCICDISFMLDGVELNPDEGLQMRSVGNLTIVLDEMDCKQDLNKEIGLELTLARGIRPIENIDGHRIRVLKSYTELSNYTLSEILGPAKSGDRLILKFTNTGGDVYSIDIL